MEIWKDINGYEGIYQVSNSGKVRSLDRIIKHKNGLKFKRKGNMIKGCLNLGGYRMFDLYKECKRKHKLSHTLVMEAFICAKKKGMDINHKNGNKDDNRLSNLEYCSRSENMKHAFEIGLCENTLKRQKQGYNSKRKVILNTETGIFYDSISDAAEAHCIKYGTLNQRISGTSPTYTPMIVVGITHGSKPFKKIKHREGQTINGTFIKD